MSARELDAAGVVDPELRLSYGRCRQLLAQHGRTYYLATLLLPPGKRPHIQAIYGLARHADELADATGDDAECTERLERWTDQFLRDLSAGASADPVAAALIHTVGVWDIPHDHLVRFVGAMRQDRTVTRYDTYERLELYMHDAAAVIGLQMLPVLQPRSPLAEEPVRAMGLAFQLTNIIRDVVEDLDRGRLYLPVEDLERFSVSVGQLQARRMTRDIAALIEFQVHRAEALYARARDVLPMLPPANRECLRVAMTLYADILGQVRSSGFDVLRGRASVGTGRRLAVAAPAAARAWLHRGRTT